MASSDRERKLRQEAFLRAFEMRRRAREQPHAQLEAKFRELAESIERELRAFQSHIRELQKGTGPKPDFRLLRHRRRRPPEAGLPQPAVPPKGPLPLQGGAEAPLDFQ